MSYSDRILYFNWFKRIAVELAVCRKAPVALNDPEVVQKFRDEQREYEEYLSNTHQ